MASTPPDRKSRVLEIIGFVGSLRPDPPNANRRSVDEDHAMDTKIFLFLLFFLKVNGKLESLKVCVVGNPKLKTTRTTKYCDLLEKSKRTLATCVYAADRVECLQMVSRRKADFSIFEPEDLYFSTLSGESSLLIVSEIRALKEKPFRYGVVAMVRENGNLTGTAELRGRRLCHPGTESRQEWNPLFGQYFEERVAPANCDDELSMYEDRIKSSSEFFGSGCIAGPWSANREEDARLKSKYSNLCALCDGGDCGSGDKYRGSGGSLICFKDGIGDVLWTKYEDVKTHIKFLETDSTDTPKYNFLCEDGSLMPVTSEEPCFWLAQPWQVVGANRKSAIDVQKLMDVLSDDEHNDWEENLIHVIELYLEYIRNLLVSRTPEDYLRRIPGYLSASAMSQGNCNPKRSVKFCVSSAVEEEKCDWMSKAGSALGIRPSLECIQKDNLTACLQSVAKKETDAVTVSPDFFYDAAVKFNLKTFLLEGGTRFNNSYLSCIISKKKSGLKKLSDLKGKKICLTRKNGIGWWSLLSALNRESLIGSFCQGSIDPFGEVCFVGGGEDSKKCCSKDGQGDNEMEVLRCLHEDKCDAAVLDFSILMGNSDGKIPVRWSKDLRLSDFETIGENERTTDCQWMWSHPHYLMTSEDLSTPKGKEIFNVFFQSGKNFGRSSQKNNPMLQIFGPFHEVKNVLFKDSSSSFIISSEWNQSNNYLDTLSRMKACSRSSPPSTLSLFNVASIAFFVFYKTEL